VAGRGWGDAPGILTLLDCADRHRGALEYDWRARFGAPFNPPAVMGWGEACRLFAVLCQDPSSQTFAAVAGWAHPVSWEWIALKQVHDRFVDAHAKRPRHLPAPWDERPTTYGHTTMTREQVIEALRRHRGSSATDTETIITI
jgi:hypothetical protein